MANWFLQQGEQRLGPMPLESLQNMTTNNQVAPSDLVWTDGMASWQTAGSQPWYANANVPYTSAENYPQAPLQGFTQVGNGYGVTQPPYAEPPNLLGWSIAVLLCCCLPGGIVGIIQSNKARSEWAKGNYAAAQSAYNTAKQTLIWSAVVGVILNVVYVILKSNHTL
jgi:hypothetical protein